MGNRREFLAQAITHISQQLAQKGWVANHDGNVSLRFDQVLLATPTAISKAQMEPTLVLTLDIEGNKLEGIGKPFSEIKLHLAAYRAREEIQAVVHAHPPFAMAWGMVGGCFQVQVPEAVISIGSEIPVLPYALPGAKENEIHIQQAFLSTDIVMMAGNGVLAVGRDVQEAFLRIELLEHLLKIEYYARGMGTPMTLPVQDRQSLMEKRAALGFVVPGAVGVPVESAGSGVAIAGDQNQMIKDLIAQELKKVLQQK